MSGALRVGAWRIHRTGGVEVLEWERRPLPPPGRGEARVRHRAIGFNFTDIYHRDGRYPIAMPSGLGNEAAGVVEAVGPGVKGVAPGQRVGYLTGSVRDAYSEARNIDARLLVPLPDAIDDATAAAVLIKGVTAQYLLNDTHRVRKGQAILWHAAAGGVGLIAVQWAKALGATVIGTVSSDAKADLARRHGCDHVVVTARDDMIDRVRSITGGRGVPVVFDSVGRDTFRASLDCLAPRGHLVSFGSASGIPDPIDIRTLSAKGSLTVTRATLVSYTTSRAELLRRARAVFAMLTTGRVRAVIGGTFPLSEAPRVHTLAQSRASTGSLIMLPESSREF
jgi:NADPH2:quinone reductase